MSLNDKIDLDKLQHVFQKQHWHVKYLNTLSGIGNIIHIFKSVPLHIQSSTDNIDVNEFIWGMKDLLLISLLVVSSFCDEPEIERGKDNIRTMCPHRYIR